VRTLRIATLVLLAAFGAIGAEGTEIRIAEQYGVAFLPLMIMRDQRMVERHAAQLGLPNLEVKWAKIGAVNAINDSLLAGELDFAAGGVPSLVLLWAKTRGTPGAVRAAAALGDIPNELVVNRPEVKTIKDLGPSDKVAVTAVKISNQAIALQMAAAREFGPDNYEKLDPLTVGMSHPDAAVALLSKSGGITAHFSSPPFLERELRAPGLHSILSTYDVLGGPATLNVIWTRTAFRAEHPKAYQAFLLALGDAMEALNRDKRAAAAVYKRLANSSESLDEITAILEDPRFAFTIVPHRVMRTADFMYRTGRVKERPASWKDLFFPEAHSSGGN